MGKTLCKKKKSGDPDAAKYICKDCERKSKKEDKLCKPKKL